MDDLITINRPIETVFAFVTDHSNDKLWKPFVIASRQIFPGAIGVGRCFEIVTRAWGYRHMGEVEMLEFEPYPYFVYRAHDKLFPFDGKLIFFGSFIRDTDARTSQIPGARRMEMGLLSAWIVFPQSN